MTGEVRLRPRIGRFVWAHCPRTVGWDSSPGMSTRDARVAHRGPNWIGIHHPGMGGLPVGAQIGLGFIAQGWEGYPSGPKLVGIHHP
eukprot:2050144-Prymnesium_polylepis.1